MRGGLNQGEILMKNVLITGGAKGIGWIIALHFLERGHRVMVVDNDLAALEELPRLGRLQTIPLDISDKKEVERLLSLFEIDILINNAAITDGDDYERIMAVNCNGTRCVTETVLRGMKERRNGNIVFITSVHTAMAFQGDAAYNSSKHWAVGYMKVRALELAPLGIRINAVAPGAILGAGSNQTVEESAVKSVESKIPLRRWGYPKDVAQAVMFLTSDEASYITGTELRVDGGLSIMNPLRS